ncbi:MAG: hypothetical protein HY978_00320 [Candidatus Liptonbacteria bacterium]|nr:hypothetical protein [Candidatus Liptonbacteria bacterium]
MKSAAKTKAALDQKLKKISETPASFNFYVCLHDFVEHIESTRSFDVFFSPTKGRRAAEIPKKYAVLKQIHQGIKDVKSPTSSDVGHDRYVAIRELSLIRKQDLSENNSFWRNRESFRKLASDIHRTLSAYLSESGRKK